jgi:putative (di)nucleoside polyphosphate hydrolase
MNHKNQDAPPEVRDAFFRANAGLLVLNALGQVLAVERGNEAGAWQLPQGGIESHETAREAAYRELTEETGLAATDVTLIAEMPQWLVYELPLEWRRKKTGWGQAQKWFVFCHIPNTKSSWQVHDKPVDDENRALGWKTFASLLATIPEFRRPVYAALQAFLQEQGIALRE